MFCRRRNGHLIHLAIHLIRIAIRTALCGLLCSPDAWRAAKPALERACERFCRTEAYRQRHIQNCQARLRCKSHGCEFNTPTAQEVAQCFAHPRCEESMEMKGGEMRDFGQRTKIERLVQVLIDVCDHSMHSAFVLRAARAGSCSC